MPIPQPRRLALVLGSALLLRLGLFAFTGVSTALERRPELTSPLTSFRSLSEGVFLRDTGFDPYAGGVFHHSPLYLLFFSYIIPVYSRALTAVLWSLADVLGGILLVRVWQARSAASTSKTTPADTSRDYLVALLYLFNPYTLLSCLARSTTSLDNVLTLAAISGAFTGQNLLSVVALAVAAQTSWYPLFLLPAVILVQQRYSGPSGTSWIVDTAAFLSFFGSLTLFSVNVLGTSWITRTWGLVLTASDLTPNVGMWWYFFTEIFDHFRLFFQGVFQFHLAIYVAPLCLRLDDPAFILLIQLGAISTWKSYPTLGDMALWAGFLGCFPEIIANLQHPLLSLTVHLYTSILLPLLHSLWLLTGTGNANFFYAATMVYGLNSTLTIADVLGAGIVHNVKSKLKGLLTTTDGTSTSDGEDAGDWSIVQLASLDG
ncbi:Phosphatidylinositol glycan anchor biosynthesis class U protein [Vanrija pseudolonga]|uniref:Phosphatidylinositol glycan anchor biosynthesis class U protein n=1 Tax=Vanrija pseudolonga TaxID=143232 RepID=A0AAF0YAH2_9TREE|nr:Phosphatidylinositol glycan anchor biosynthesis class U protein [Vanrija pseudolonga]